MRLTRLQATDFLAFSNVDIPLDRPLTVIVGPNGTGKSTVGRAIEVVGLVLRAANGPDWSAVESEFSNAGHRGTRDFEVRLSVEFDSDVEQALILTWYRAALISQLKVPLDHGPHIVERRVMQLLDVGSVAPLFRGIVVVRRRYHGPRTWMAWYDFDPNTTAFPSARVQLVSDRTGDVYGVPPGNVPIPLPSESLKDRYFEVPTEGKLRHVPSVGELVADGGATGFVAESTSTSLGPPLSVRELYEQIGYTSGHDASRHVPFVVVLDRLVSSAVTLTDNHRAPMQLLYAVDDLGPAPNIRDGQLLPAALYRLKNGTAADRAQWHRARRYFTSLYPGKELEIRVGDPVKVNRVGESDREATGTYVVPQVIDSEGDFEVPMRLAGAGAAEAAFVATTLATSQGGVVLLDEPATNLSTTAQRRLLDVLGDYDRGQVILVTHSPDLVRLRRADDLSTLVRLSPGNGCTMVHHHPAPDSGRFQQMLSHADVRSILFAAGVILLEGETELGALDRWLADSPATGLPSHDDRNVRLINVGGDSEFGKYIELAETFGIPWVVFADAPVFAPGSSLEKQLRKWDKARGRTERLPAMPKKANFATQHGHWRAAGVFTVATALRTAGSAPVAPGVKKGEIEEWLYRLDPAAYQAALAANPGSKPRVGAAFASTVPVPNELTDIWRDMLTHLALL